MLAFFYGFSYIANVMCAECGEREAVVFMRRSGYGDGAGCDLILCELCARERGIIAGKGSLDLNIDDLIGKTLAAKPPRHRPLACPSCGQDFEAIRSSGRLGCAGCADVFSVEVGRIMEMRRIPGMRGIQERGIPAFDFSPLSGEDMLAPELEAALASEDYEKASSLRDEISRRSEGKGALPAIASSDFPLGPDPFASAPGPDEDVVLQTSAWVYRDLEGLPFPHSPRGPAAPSRARLLERFASDSSWHSIPLAGLAPASRRALSERCLASRGYAADEESVLVSKPATGCYALLDETDHLRLRALRRGFDPGRAWAAALDEAALLEKDLSFARRPGFGWICAHLSDCGLGSSLGALLHLPALSAAGLRDRLFRALMAEGLVLRGYYSSSEDSSGSVYELCIESSGFSSSKAMLELFSASVAKAVEAERRARSGLSERALESLADAEGRAFGIARYCRSLGAEEAASIVSTLRLATLRGALKGVAARGLGSLLLSLGSASLCMASGLRELPAPSSAVDSLRSSSVKNALITAEFDDEEGVRCSKD